MQVIVKSTPLIQESQLAKKVFPYVLHSSTFQQYIIV